MAVNHIILPKLGKKYSTTLAGQINTMELNLPPNISENEIIRRKIDFPLNFSNRPQNSTPTSWVSTFLHKANTRG